MNVTDVDFLKLSIDLDYSARDALQDTPLSKAMVFDITDVDLLSEWYVILTDTSREIESFVRAFRLAEVDDDDYFRRTAGKIAYCEIAARWVEGRLIQLGAAPPYFPADPRMREITRLHEQVKKLKTRVQFIENANDRAAA